MDKHMHAYIHKYTPTYVFMHIVILIIGKMMSSWLEHADVISYPQIWGRG